MINRYTGGLGEREGGDLIRWDLEVESFIRDEYVFGSRYPMQFVEKPPEATLTLYEINQAESVAVIKLLNEMRSGPNIPTPAQRAPDIGDRFAGLELPNER